LVELLTGATCLSSTFYRFAIGLFIAITPISSVEFYFTSDGRWVALKYSNNLSR